MSKSVVNNLVNNVVNIPGSSPSLHHPLSYPAHGGIWRRISKHYLGGAAESFPDQPQPWAAPGWRVACIKK